METFLYVKNSLSTLLSQFLNSVRISKVEKSGIQPKQAVWYSSEKYYSVTPVSADLASADLTYSRCRGYQGKATSGLLIKPEVAFWGPQDACGGPWKLLWATEGLPEP